jgi:hypothetical protein
MSRSKKVLRTVAVVGMLAALGGVGAFSVFSAQTENPDNRVSAGTVTIADNGGGSALYDYANAKPGGSAAAKCIRVNYTGSLPANVKLYTPSTIGELGPHANLKIEAGTQSTFNADCTGFSAQRTVFDAALSTFPTSYAGGASDNPQGQSAWNEGDAVVYRFTASLSSSTPNSMQGKTTGLHTIRWEAQNQP